jgi:hypothetical protein
VQAPEVDYAEGGQLGGTRKRTAFHSEARLGKRYPLGGDRSRSGNRRRLACPSRPDRFVLTATYLRASLRLAWD